MENKYVGGDISIGMHSSLYALDSSSYLIFTVLIKDLSKKFLKI